jgi:hypothetical protein
MHSKLIYAILVRLTLRRDLSVGNLHATCNVLEHSTHSPAHFKSLPLRQATLQASGHSRTSPSLSKTFQPNRPYRRPCHPKDGGAPMLELPSPREKKKKESPINATAGPS